MTPSPKNHILATRIQEVILNDDGTVKASDDTLIPLEPKSFIGDIHPFFLGLIPLLGTIDKKLDYPCVNIRTGQDALIIDLRFQRDGDELYMLLIDLTEHYEASQPLVQEKNVASIEKHRLAFDKRLLQVLQYIRALC